MGDNPNHPGQNAMAPQHMDMHMGGNRGGPPFMENMGKLFFSLGTCDNFIWVVVLYHYTGEPFFVV